ncbi:hypothetical protein KY284_003050 [Solanum tuberosum]|nr:hypothetical protein KY284_003050 [Solanum tuberosum]
MSTVSVTTMMMIGDLLMDWLIMTLKIHEQIEDDDEKMGNYSSSISDYDDDRGTTYGLAYDSRSEDYKVLMIDMCGKNDNEILALKNGSWKIIDRKTSGRTDSDEIYGEISLPEIVSSELTLRFLDEIVHYTDCALIKRIG